MERRNIQVLEDGQDMFQVGRDICQMGRQEDAFLVLDVGDVVRKYEQWVTKMPRVKPFYAVKCNDDPRVVRTLASLGAGFDCASKAEIDKVLSVGVDASRIVFANTAKPASHIRHAASRGVHLQTFDNDIEMRKILDINPQAKLLLRYRFDGATITFGMKFGCDPLTEAPGILRAARDAGADVVGVCFHGAIVKDDPQLVRKAIEVGRSLFDFAAQELGYEMKMLDIGGGFDGYRGSSIDEHANVINTALAELFPSPEVKVLSEPGKYFIASAVNVYAQVHAKRVTELGGRQHVMYFINDGVHGNFKPSFRPGFMPLPIPYSVIPYRRPSVYSSVWGPTCDSTDGLFKDLYLPDLTAGVDWLVFEDMGAYSYVVATGFNGFPLPRIHAVIDKKSWTLLRDKPQFSPDVFLTGSTADILHDGLVNICENIVSNGMNKISNN